MVWSGDYIRALLRGGSGAHRLRSGLSPALPCEALADPGYQKVLLNTFEIALIVTVAAVLLGYPTAYFLSRLPRERAGKYLLMVMFPLLTSLLVRTYAWIALLQDTGIVHISTW